MNTTQNGAKKKAEVDAVQAKRKDKGLDSFKRAAAAWKMDGRPGGIVVKQSGPTPGSKP